MSDSTRCNVDAASTTGRDVHGINTEASVWRSGCARPLARLRRLAKRWIHRFVVVEDSMRPCLLPGDGLIAIRTSRVRRGQLRVFRYSRGAGSEVLDTHQSGRGLRSEAEGIWLVKRVGRIERDAGGMSFEARSDNPSAEGVVDSRRFGLVRVEDSMRVVYVHKAAPSTNQ